MISFTADDKKAFNKFTEGRKCRHSFHILHQHNAPINVMPAGGGGGGGRGEAGHRVGI